MNNQGPESYSKIPSINYLHVVFEDMEEVEVNAVISAFNEGECTKKNTTITSVRPKRSVDLIAGNYSMGVEPSRGDSYYTKKRKLGDELLSNSKSSGTSSSGTGGYVNPSNCTIPDLNNLGTGGYLNYDTYKQWPSQPFIAPNQSFPISTLRFKETYLIDKIVDENGIQLIFKVSKYPPSHELQIGDEIFKEIYEVQYGVLVFVKRVNGKYVPPKPASYDFDNYE